MPRRKRFDVAPNERQGGGWKVRMSAENPSLVCLPSPARNARSATITSPSAMSLACHPAQMPVMINKLGLTPCLSRRTSAAVASPPYFQSEPATTVRERGPHANWAE